MNKIYKVKVDQVIDDIIPIKQLSLDTSYIYTLTPINVEEKYSVIDANKSKIKKMGILTYALDCDHFIKMRIFWKIKRLKKIENVSEFQFIVYNYVKEQEQNIMDLIRAIKIQLLDKVEDKYDYIYDTVCNYLDNEFVCKKICDFKNDRCIAKREYNLTCGCCRHPKNKKLFLISNELVVCEYLKEKQCLAHCLTCKLFTCDYIIRHKKIKFRIRDIFLLNYYFNPIQKLIILTSHFTTKDEIIKKILKWR